MEERRAPSAKSVFVTPQKRPNAEESAGSEGSKFQRGGEEDVAEAEFTLQFQGDNSVTLIPGTNKLNVLDTIGDEDPAALVVYDDDNCIAAVAILNALPAGMFPAWLNGGVAPVSLAHFKTSLINRVHGLAAVPSHVSGNCLIAPCTISEHVRVCVQMYSLALDPTLGLIPPAHLPLARNFLIADGSRKTTAIADPIQQPPAPLNGIIN